MPEKPGFSPDTPEDQPEKVPSPDDVKLWPPDKAAEGAPEGTEAPTVSESGPESGEVSEDVVLGKYNGEPLTSLSLDDAPLVRETLDWYKQSFEYESHQTKEPSAANMKDLLNDAEAQGLIHFDAEAKRYRPIEVNDAELKQEVADFFIGSKEKPAEGLHLYESKKAEERESMVSEARRAVEDSSKGDKLADATEPKSDKEAEPKSADNHPEKAKEARQRIEAAVAEINRETARNQAEVAKVKSEMELIKAKDAADALTQSREEAINKAQVEKEALAKSQEEADIKAKADAAEQVKTDYLAGEKQKRNLGAYSEEVHAEAQAIQKDHEREAKYGSGVDAQGRAYNEATKIQAEREQTRRRRELSERLESMLLHPQLVFNAESARAQAIAEGKDRARREGNDHEFLSQMEVYQKFQAAIDKEPDPNIRKNLEGQRDDAVEKEKARVVKLSEAIAKHRAESVVLAADLIGKARRHEQSVNVTQIAGAEPEAKLQAQREALLLRDSLNLNGTPFMEVTRGGIFHRRENRGPKIIEGYFEVHNNDGEIVPNMVVMERRKRETGELLSQVVMTTREPLTRDNVSRAFGGALEYTLPPKEIQETVDKARRDDHAALEKDFGDQLWGARSITEIIDLGPGPMQAIDGPNGAYAYNGASQAELTRVRNVRPARGGIFYWLTGARGTFRG